ncbi:DUF3987 domain-containing protein [Acidobacteria bacterium AH-259-O06]|nr:DUF3987 domain-containing protein [Acidobacteria bacterium AH-259-O06]
MGDAPTDGQVGYQTLEDEARRLVKGGCSVIPIKPDGSKAPAVSEWKPYQKNIVDPKVLNFWFGEGGKGLAIVAGKVSKNVEIIDVDDPDSVNEWEALVREAGGAELLETLPTVLTPSGGSHFYFRCPDGVEGNQKLAQRKGKNGRPEVLIETRGEGGYALLPESPPECHSSNQPYILVRGNLAEIPTISGEERSLLLDSARALNEYIQPSKIKSGPSNTTGNRPGDDFNARASWGEILEPRGWQRVGQHGEVTRWRRPGKKIGISATTNFKGTNLFYNFSTNGGPFEAETGYTKFAAYTLLEHDGDFSASAADLAAKGYGGQETETDHSWPKRVQLPPPFSEAPQLRSELIPEPLRDWILDIAERMQIPPEMITIPAVVGISSLIGRRQGIHPKQYDDWLEVPNQWGAVVADSGTLKSAAQSQGLKLIEALATQATQKYVEAYAQYSGAAEAHKAERAALKSEISKAIRNEGDNLDQLKDRLAKLESMIRDQPVEKRYITNDPTVEKLAELLRDNPGGLLLARDELAGWLRILEKFGREGDREFYLEAWNGKNSYVVDRIERGTIHVPALCISIIGGIQPGKLNRYFADIAEGELSDDGFLQRFQLMVYPQLSTGWKNVDREPDRRADQRARKVFRKLDQELPERDSRAAALRFSSEAQKFFNAWRQALEKRLRSGEIECEPLRAHLAKYRSTMPTLALIFHLVAWADGSNELSPVTLSAAEMAADWCDFLEVNALKIYAVAIRPDLQAAHNLAERIDQGEVKDRELVRDIQRHHWSFLTTSNLVEQALNLLGEYGWVKVETIITGGRPSKIVRLHPELRESGQGESDQAKYAGVGEVEN